MSEAQKLPVAIYGFSFQFGGKHPVMTLVGQADIAQDHGKDILICHSKMMDYRCVSTKDEAVLYLREKGATAIIEGSPIQYLDEVPT